MMPSQLRTGKLTRMMNLIVKAGLDDICKEDIDFLKYCRDTKWGKFSGVLIKDGLPIMADEVRHDVRFGEGYDVAPRSRETTDELVQLLGRVSALLEKLEAQDSE